MSGSVLFGFAVEPKGQTPGYVDQVHSAEVIETHSLEDTTRTVKPKADAVVTKVKDLSIHVFTADCCPVLFFSVDESGPIAAIHSGWRGTMQGIVRRTAERYFPDPFKVVVGPCLRACCFEVKRDFIDEFTKARGDIAAFVIEREGRLFFDLVKFIVERELTGLSAQTIDVTAARCTVCSEPRLPSYRRNRSTDPRIKAWIKRRSQYPIES